MKKTTYSPYADYTKIVGYRLGPNEEELEIIRKTSSHLRICLDCHAPIIAKQDRCHICQGDNFKVISK